MSEKMVILGLDFRGIGIVNRLRFLWDVFVKGYCFIEVPQEQVTVIGRNELN